MCVPFFPRSDGRPEQRREKEEEAFWSGAEEGRTPIYGEKRRRQNYKSPNNAKRKEGLGREGF